VVFLNFEGALESIPTVLRIRDVYPGSWILIFTHSGSQISDPGSKNSNKREGLNKFFVKPFFVATNFTKLKIILILHVANMLKKKIWASFQRIKEHYSFYPKICHQALLKSYGSGSCSYF
jgi:hypothetical protein